MAPGISVSWDPAVPQRCVGYHVSDRVNGETESAVHRAPWLRLVAVETLDHRLYLPLDRSLLDAEIAAAQLEAARTLHPHGPTAQYLVRSAFVRARRAARGVAGYLESFVVNTRRPPPALEAALAKLERCYTALLAEIPRSDESDADLEAVPSRWRQLTAIDDSEVERHPPVATARRVGREPTADDLIDPRQLPARVLRLGAATNAAEIGVTPERCDDHRALRVRVPAFGKRSTPDEVTDVAIRLVDRDTGGEHGHALLGEPTSSPGQEDRYLEGVVVLPDAVTPEEVRVDLYAVGHADPPPPANPEELRRARRAILFLSEYRALVADVRLWGADAAPAARLRTIIRKLATDGRSARQGPGPLWAGGPSSSHLRRLADLGDRALTALLRDGTTEDGKPIPGDHDGGAAAVVAAVSGPGDLLVAELAAARDRSVPSSQPQSQSPEGTHPPTRRPTRR